MGVPFCPKCQSLLVLKDGDKKQLFCEQCRQSFTHQDISSREPEPKKPVVTPGVLADNNVFADYEHVCSKCGYDKAEVIDMGVFISDEDTLIMIKCGKCGFSERVGRRVA